jgi:Zn-dependent M28 family amino/carboxypeptidase
VIDAIDPERLDRHMRALAGFGSRDPRHPGHAQAIAYIKQELAKIADVTVSEHRAVYQSTPLTNILATIDPTDPRGSVDTGWVLVAAHYDSIANRTPGWRPAIDPAPGADDNATGTAALLEYARLLSTQRECLGSRVVLAFFDGEEFFFKGSAAYLQSLPKPYPIAFVVNIDMVGFNPIADRLDLIWYGPQSDVLRDRIKEVNDRYQIGIRLVEVFANDGSRYILDSAPFGLAGIPSITLAERYGPADATYPGNTFFHTVNDTPDKVTNPGLWLKAAKLTLATALELARFE